MKRRKVRFTATAREHLRHFKAWWRENSARPEILERDLAKAIEILAILPGVGSPYPDASTPGVRRLFIERLTSHLYYTYDSTEVVVRALWHARRGSKPPLTAR